MYCKCDHKTGMH